MLTEHKDKISRELSGGMKRKLSLAMAIVTAPKVLVLDELNESNRRKLYKKNGLNGIIYDRIVDDEIESDEIQTIPLPALVTVNN